MTYYLALAFNASGQWVETFGSKSESDVDFEVQCWKDDGFKARLIYRKTFQSMPSQSEVQAFASLLRD